jgi:dihydroneopterin aldolase
MAGHFTIELMGLRFFAEHGMYREEVSVGNEFEVNVSIYCKAPKKEITSITQTVNYVEVYRIIQEYFHIRRQLLEESAMEIADQLKQQFEAIESIRITIKKLNPPIINFTGTVGITYSKEFK